LAKQLTLEQLKVMPAEQRTNLYTNAVRIGSQEAMAVAEILVKHNLLVTSTGGFPREHPIIRCVEEIITSTAGKAAAKQAADDGLPALAGLDPLLSKELGNDYGPSFGVTSWAGSIVAEQMRKLGYKEKGQRSLPTGCVAKTGSFFQKR
jgi:hypothetical protein